tara:strand:+ start:2479 stop:3174 length:696 start_codon:yes stop_codon:yes gene_type:complete
MKLYFLVEGVSSEMSAYPVWIKSILPMLDRYQEYDDFVTSNKGFYIISGYGYPSILNHIADASSNIVEMNNVNHFFIILDADEDSVEVREQEVLKTIFECDLPTNTEVHVIVQNRCFETILLANRKVIPRQAKSEPLIAYKRYYDVINDDPEMMGQYDDERFTHSQFHAEYAFKALREKRISYSKSNPQSICNEVYINEIIKRTRESEHIKSFKIFIDKLKYIKSTMDELE